MWIEKQEHLINEARETYNWAIENEIVKNRHAVLLKEILSAECI